MIDIPYSGILELRKVARWLEAGAPEAKNHGMRFDMKTVIDVPQQTQKVTAQNWCGTACCIAGAMYAFAYPQEIALELNTTGGVDDAAWSMAIDLLGNYNREVFSLFEPWEFGFPDVTPAAIDPAWAARTIRHLIATGQVDWKATSLKSQ